jgi:hypothetical protein
MPTFVIKGSRRRLEQVQATVTANDLATAAADFVAAVELESPPFPVDVTGSSIIAGAARAAKRVRVEEDNIP